MEAAIKMQAFRESDHLGRIEAVFAHYMRNAMAAQQALKLIESARKDPSGMFLVEMIYEQINKDSPIPDVWRHYGPD